MLYWIVLYGNAGQATDVVPINLRHLIYLTQRNFENEQRKIHLIHFRW